MLPLRSGAPLLTSTKVVAYHRFYGNGRDAGRSGSLDRLQRIAGEARAIKLEPQSNRHWARRALLPNDIRQWR
jgi:hypothetical protein